jgi:hypothetical protein
MSVRPIAERLLAVGMLLWLVSGTALAQSGNEKSLQLLQRLYQERYEEFRKEMHALADFCEEQTFLTTAAMIRHRASPVEERQAELDDLPEQVQPPLPPGAPDADRQWRVKLQKLEKDYAIALYRLARRALQQSHASFAFQLVREVAYHDPDHEHARRMLGFVRDGDEWTTPFARTMRRRGYVDHPEFGWLPKRHVPRHEEGERLFNGKWISAAREAALRSQFQNGWEIETEHFLVKTNHSLEKGVEISRELEAFHRFFIRELPGFFNSPQQMQKLFDEGAAGSGPSSKRHRVYYYRDKADFVSALRSRQPNVEMINGLYIPADRTAYFYHDPDPFHLETMFHEVTHQLLGESGNRQVNVGEAADFWVIEGIACYMESYRHDEEGTRVGEPHPRTFWARRKALDETQYIPMRRFMALGKQDFQTPDMTQLHGYYSQATGMVHFFLHYREGIYRDAFIEYLAHVYSPVNRIRHVASIETSTGVRLETLDEQYLEHLRSLPADPPPGVKVIRETSQ